MTAGSGKDGAGKGSARGPRPGDDAAGSAGSPQFAGGDAPLGGDLHIVRFAPAKLNLTLAVAGRRDDGYHALHSVMVPLSLGDALTVSLAADPLGGDTLRVSGVPVTADSDNLVLRAIEATRSAVAATWPGAPSEPPALAARLIKRIPVAAGLGGGSSDAAAAMEAALAAWHTDLEPAAKAALAASLGSDVPFFLARGPALITGRGENVEPLPAIGGDSPAILLVTPRLAVATPAVFGAYAAGERLADPGRARDISEELAGQLRVGPVAGRRPGGSAALAILNLASNLASANDLVPATVAVAPELEEFIRRLEKLVHRPVCQSGSGPTQWVLYPTLAEARKAVRLVHLAVARGNLPSIGDGEPFVAATAIVDLTEMAVLPAANRSGSADRPRTLHNGPDAGAHPQGGSTNEPPSPHGDDSR
jgi:4-diphosphocytidyl-2-C-methyl-D-erythritol kinase